jgi:hypothetical protein
MRLRIEEYFGVHHPLLPCLGKVGFGKVSKVLLGAQDPHGGIVQCEKRLQIGELRGLAECLNRQIAERDLIAFGELKDKFWLKRPFYIQV